MNKSMNHKTEIQGKGLSYSLPSVGNQTTGDWL